MKVSELTEVMEKPLVDSKAPRCWFRHTNIYYVWMYVCLYCIAGRQASKHVYTSSALHVAQSNNNTVSTIEEWLFIWIERSNGIATLAHQQWHRQQQQQRQRQQRHQQNQRKQQLPLLHISTSTSTILCCCYYCYYYHHHNNSYFIQSTWKMFRFGYDSVLLTNPK